MSRSKIDAPITAAEPPYFRPDPIDLDTFPLERTTMLQALFRVSPPSFPFDLNRLTHLHFPRSEVEIVKIGQAPFEPHEVEEFARLFDGLTARWREIGIGPIRLLYYMLCIEPAEYRNITLTFGGFPPLPGPERYSYVDDESLMPIVAASDWMYYDQYLESALDDLGVSWLQVEDAMAAAYLTALPPLYLDRTDGLSTPLRIVLWRNELAEWARTREREGDVAIAAQQLNARIAGTKLGQAYGPSLTKLYRSAVAGNDELAREWGLMQHHRQNRPVTKSVVRAGRDCGGGRQGDRHMTAAINTT